MAADCGIGWLAVNLYAGCNVCGLRRGNTACRLCGNGGCCMCVPTDAHCPIHIAGYGVDYFYRNFDTIRVAAAYGYDCTTLPAVTPDLSTVGVPCMACCVPCIDAAVAL